MARPRILRATVKTQALDGVGWRVAMSCLMALTIFVSTFICASNACAAFDGDQAVVTLTLGDKAEVASSDPAADSAFHDKVAGAYANCTGHCAAHSLSLPTPVVQLVTFAPTVLAWGLPMTDRLALGGPALLERPPRL